MKKEEAKIKKESLLKEIEILDNIINTPSITAEQRLLEMFNNCVINTKIKDGSIIFYNDGKAYFEIEKNNIWCRYEYVWEILEDEYSLKYYEIQALIKKVLENTFKINGLKPFSGINHCLSLLENESRNEKDIERARQTCLIHRR